MDKMLMNAAVDLHRSERLLTIARRQGQAVMPDDELDEVIRAVRHVVHGLLAHWLGDLPG